MMSVRIVSAPAKLNLTLHIRGRRADGMHLLDSTMVLINYADTVYLKPRTDGKIVREWQHEKISEAEDLAHRAARRLADFAQNRTGGAGAFCGVSIAIEKRIPLGGGLGGGSADAAAVLLGLNRLWQLNLTKTQLMDIIAAPVPTLGADTAFFLHGVPAQASGIGDCLRPASLIPPPAYLLLFPPCAAQTGAVYQEYDRLAAGAAVSAAAIPSFMQRSENDLTAAALSLYPQIAESAKALYNVAGEARLSGSGATLYAAFPSLAQAEQAKMQLPQSLQSAVTELLMQHPAE